MTLIEKFGQYVKKRRLEKGLTQERLSQLVFMNSNNGYLSKLENGKNNNITFSTVEKILEILESDVEFINLD